jgi:hypothetical protein
MGENSGYVSVALVQRARKQILHVQERGVGFEVRAVETQTLHAYDAENIAPLAVRNTRIVAGPTWLGGSRQTKWPRNEPDPTSV